MAGPERFMDMLGPGGGMAFGPDWLQNYINQSRGFINRTAPEIPKTAKSTLDNILKTSGGNSTVSNLINQAKNRLGLSPLDLDLNIKGPNILDKTKFRLGGVKEFLDKPINIGGEMQRYGIRENIKGAADFLKGKVGDVRNLGAFKSGINFTPRSILNPTWGLAKRGLTAQGIEQLTGVKNVYVTPGEIVKGAKMLTNPVTLKAGAAATALSLLDQRPAGPKDEFADYRAFLNENTAAAKKSLSELPESDLTIDQLQEKIKLRNLISQNETDPLNQSFYQGPQASQETTEFTQLAPAPVLNRVIGDPGPRTPPSFAINTGLVNPAPVVVDSAVTSTIPSEDAAQSLVEQAKAKWIADTANSPAQQSGAFKPEQLWETHLNNQRWRKDQGRNFTHGEYL
tara:strand:- start:3284 stop:4477 length:1194 start_codon:yes stop_codon:yes gene_type:complete